MGVGPCGPNTEIFFDRGERYDKRGKELLERNISNDRYIEIWNIVFSQFNNDGSGSYTELKTKCIDTGAGLERISSILQDAPTNFDTDLFLPIIKEIELVTKKKYETENFFQKDHLQASINRDFKVVADHMRAVCNLIADGQYPSNVSRGYIIRRLIRRASFSMSRLLSERSPALFRLVKAVSAISYYKFEAREIEGIILAEEKRFLKLLEDGIVILKSEISKRDGGLSLEKMAFKLYETHGLPVEITVDILKDMGVEVNMKDVLEFQKEHSLISKSRSNNPLGRVINSLEGIGFKGGGFLGYETLETHSRILFLANSQEELQKTDGETFFILDRTPFYARRGGQNSDRGIVINGDYSYQLEDIFIDKFGNYVHRINAPLRINDTLICKVDEKVRIAHSRNHSATHLLFSVLRDFLPKEQILQKGSDITEEKFTFDFSLNRRLTEKEIDEIEDKVNRLISKNIVRIYQNSSLKEARELGAVITAEEEEYLEPNNVRLVNFVGVTLDVCGGTHVNSTSEIEAFKIISFKGKGVERFRITAITSYNTVKDFYRKSIFEEREKLIFSSSKLNDPKEILSLLNEKTKTVPDKIEGLEELLLSLKKLSEETSKKIRQEYRSYKKKNLNLNLFSCRIFNGVKVCFCSHEDNDVAKKLVASAKSNINSDINLAVTKLSKDGELNIFVTSKGKLAADFSDFLKASNINFRGGGKEGFVQGVIEWDKEEGELLELLKKWLES